MESPELLQLITVLITLPTLLKKILQFADLLRAEVSEREKLDREIRNGNINYYDSLKGLLEGWIGRSGKEARGEALVKILKEIDCLDAAEVIENDFLSTKFFLNLSITKIAKMELPFPQSFPGFQLKSYLGHGTFGLAWKASDEIEKMDYALKLLPFIETDFAELEASESSLEDHPNIVKNYSFFENEVTLAQFQDLLSSVALGIKSRHLLNVLKTGEKVTFLYIKMSLCGESLRSWLNLEHDKDSVEVQKTQQTIVIETIEGVKYLHEQRLIHHNLRPENIFFSSSGYKFPIKIVDYCIPNKNKMGKLRIGPDLYRAPERLEADNSFKSDLFSLGLLIWEVIQLIQYNKVRIFFERFVDGEIGAVLHNPLLLNLNSLVSKLCSKESPTLDKIWLGWGTNGGINAADSQGLLDILNNCEDGWTINLLDGDVYKGSFAIRRKNISLRGKGNNTVLTNDGNVLDISGDNCHALNFTIDGKKCDSFGIHVWNSNRPMHNCILENVHITNCKEGIRVGFKTAKTTINYATFSENETAIFSDGDSVHVSNCGITNCGLGVVIRSCINTSIESIKICNPQLCGISISLVKGCLKLVDAQIEASSERHQKLPEEKPRPYCGIASWDWYINGKIEFDRVTCSGFEGEEEYGLYKDCEQAGIQVKDSTLGKVFVDEKEYYKYWNFIP